MSTTETFELASLIAQFWSKDTFQVSLCVIELTISNFYKPEDQPNVGI